MDFESQLPSICTLYPKLKVMHGPPGSYLYGTLDVFDENGKPLEEFDVEIRKSPDYPLRFPVLYEVGGKIPHLLDWHIYASQAGPKKACCITVPPVEILASRKGITVQRYIGQFVIPYLYKQAHRRKYGYYPGKEYGHGAVGLWEYYTNLLDTSDKREVIKILDQHSKKLHKKSPCFCGSNRRFRNCHLEAYQALKNLPSDFIDEQIKWLSKFL